MEDGNSIAVKDVFCIYPASFVAIWPSPILSTPPEITSFCAEKATVAPFTVMFPFEFVPPSVRPIAFNVSDLGTAFSVNVYSAVFGFDPTDFSVLSFRTVLPSAVITTSFKQSFLPPLVYVNVIVLLPVLNAFAGKLHSYGCHSVVKSFFFQPVMSMQYFGAKAAALSTLIAGFVAFAAFVVFAAGDAS